MKKLLIILAALAMIFSSGCWSCRKNNNNCKRSIAPEANTLISNAQSGNFLYPAGFYIDTTPPVSTCYYYSFVCASTTVRQTLFLIIQIRLMPGVIPHIPSAQQACITNATGTQIRFFNKEFIIVVIMIPQQGFCNL